MRMSISEVYAWNNVIFIPWIGKQYFNGGIFGKKILVLGDSHYCQDNDCKTCGVLGSNPIEMGDCRKLTCNTVKSFLDKNAEFEKWKNTFKK